jgi:hypothetical protein
MLRGMGVEKFPASVLYKDSYPMKIVIGASIYKFFDVIDLVRNIDKKCPLGHTLSELCPESYVNWRCNECNK